MKKEEHWQIIQDLWQEQKLSLGQELEKNAQENGAKTALFYKEQKISYRELNAGANRYAHCFSQLGFKSGDVVVLFMKNRPEYLMAASGLSKLGIIVSLVDVGIRGDVLAHDINLCEARAIIVGEELLTVFSEVEPRLRLRSPALIMVDGGNRHDQLAGRMQQLAPLLEQASDSNPAAAGDISSEEIFAYLYTPGTTGLRKAVPVSHQRSLIKAHLFGLLGHMDQNTIQYMCLPLHYNGGFIGAYTAMIATGSSMVLRSAFSVHNFWDDIRTCGANYMISVGEIARYLYNQPEQENDADNPLQTMICSGMWGDLTASFRKRFGLQHIIDLYAKTEGIGNFVNFEEIPDMCGNLTLLSLRQGEVVKYDYKNKQIKRDENGQVVKCGAGETGLLICTINEFNRFYPYVNDPEATEKALLRDVFETGDQYFDSGDLVQLHENDYISYVDRLGDTYRWKGRTVADNQVADVIRKFYGGIEDALAYGVKIPGQEGRCGMAAISLLEGENLDWDNFLKHLDHRMPEHARPLFVRVNARLEGDQDCEEYKEVLRQEGFNPDRIKDPIFFLHPEREKYIPMNRELYEQIINQQIPI